MRIISECRTASPQLVSSSALGRGPTEPHSQRARKALHDAASARAHINVSRTLGPRDKPEDDNRGWGCGLFLSAHHLPLSPSAYGERAEAGAVWPAEGEGQPLAPNPLLPLTLTLSPHRTGRGDTHLTLTLSPYKAGRGDDGRRP